MGAGDVEPFDWTNGAGGAGATGDVKYDPQGRAYLITANNPEGVRIPYRDRAPDSKPVTYTSAGAGFPPGTLRGSDGNLYTAGSGTAPGGYTAPTEDGYGGNTWGGGQGQPTPYTGSSGAGGGITAYQGGQLAIDRERLDLQRQQNEAANQQAQATLTQRMQIEDNNLAFLKDKEAYARGADNQKLVLETQKQLFTQQSTMATLQMQQAQLSAAREVANLQSQQEADRFNSTQGFAVAQANQRAQAEKQQQLQGLAKDIGVLGADPGDRARLASTILANSGWGQANTATAGANFITPESLMPLDALLHNRQNVMAQPDNPFTFTPIQARQAAPINFSGVTMPGGSNGAPNPNAVTTWMPGSGPVAGAPGSLGAAPAQTAANGTQTAGGFSWSPTGTGGIQAAEGGGFLGGAYISGEAGPEINIPLGDGQTLVLNEQQAAQHGLDLKAMMKGGQSQLATGGIFDATPTAPTASSGGGLYGGADLGDQSLARNFLQESSTRARSGTPWQTGTLPTSVYASSPGFSPLVAQLLASINAQASGVPQDFFLEQANMYRPTAVNEHVIGRSR